MHTILHTHQHRTDKNHNVILLLLPGVIFTLVLCIYLLLRIQRHELLIISNSTESTQMLLDNDTTSY